jgi:hypothetical protein
MNTRSDKAIIVKPVAGMANRMFQLMVAHELQRRVGQDIAIYGYDVKEWGLTAPLPDLPKSARLLTIFGNNFNLDEYALALRLGVVDAVVVQGWGMRLSYFDGPERNAALFSAPDTPFYRGADDELVIHVRGGDAITTPFAQYYPMAISYYREVIASSGLKPVFVGQLHEGDYAQLVRDAFPDARFLDPAGEVEDFQTIRHARHASISVSTFSWLAAWFSTTLETIHMPVRGLFDPYEPKAMLIPLNDPRYRFWDTPFPDPEQRKQVDPVEWLSSREGTRELSRAEVRRQVLQAIAGGKPDARA